MKTSTAYEGRRTLGDVERVVLTAALKRGARERALDLLQGSTAASEQVPVMQRACCG